MNNKIENILKEIKTKEIELRNPKTTTEEVNVGGVKQISTTFSFNDVLNGREYGKVISLLIFSALVNLFDFTKAKDANDVAIGISQSTHKNKDKILALWNEIKDLYPFLNGLLPLLASYHLQDYQKNEREVADWVNLNYLTIQPDMNAEGYAFDMALKLQKELDVDLEHGSILYSVENIIGMGFLQYLPIPTDANVTLFH